MDDMFIPIDDGASRYIGRECKPKEHGLLAFPCDTGYIQLDVRQKWHMDYVPKHDCCFMEYKQLHVKIRTATFMEIFTLTKDPCCAVQREMEKVMMEYKL